MYVPEDAYQYGGGGYRDSRSMVFDGKRMRKPVQRKTVDFNSTLIQYHEVRMRSRDPRDLYALQPSNAYVRDVRRAGQWRQLLPPLAYAHAPITSATTHWVHTSTNKVRGPVNVVTWTPEGRRLITGSSSGEFTLWNGLTFNFETILQAHDTAVRTMRWSHNGVWLLSGDHGGVIKYWQSNMNNVKEVNGHDEAVRDIVFSPTDEKFCSCSDDIKIKIWDFLRSECEVTLEGHGWDVKSVSWHPWKSLIVSGSKDSLLKLWDAKSGKHISTLHGHKGTVLKVSCNMNGNWLIRDQSIKLFDLRTGNELQTFRGHNKEVDSIAWHPVHENMFVSGGYDGSVMFWEVGSDEPIAEVAEAHDSSVWSLDWHPVGHILCSGSNDHTTKFWCRNRPGEALDDKHNAPFADAARARAVQMGVVKDDAATAGAAQEESLAAWLTAPVVPGGEEVPGFGAVPGFGSARALERQEEESKRQKEEQRKRQQEIIAQQIEQQRKQLAEKRLAAERAARESDVKKAQESADRPADHVHAMQQMQQRHGSGSGGPPRSFPPQYGASVPMQGMPMGAGSSAPLAGGRAVPSGLAPPQGRVGLLGDGRAAMAGGDPRLMDPRARADVGNGADPRRPLPRDPRAIGGAGSGSGGGGGADPRMMAGHAPGVDPRNAGVPMPMRDPRLQHQGHQQRMPPPGWSEGRR